MAGLKDSGNKPTRRNACCNRQWLNEPTELGEGNNHVADRSSACSVSKLTGDFCFVTGHLYRPFFKKRGGGKGDWGSPGDEIVQVMMDPLDPMYDDWPDEALHAALLEHLSSQSPRALTPSPANVVEEGRLLKQENCTSKASEARISEIVLAKQVKQVLPKVNGSEVEADQMRGPQSVTPPTLPK